VKIVIVIEAIPPYCGGAEHVAWIHATQMAVEHEVSVVTFAEERRTELREGVTVQFMPATKRKLASYLSTHRSLLNDCIDSIAPDIIHCHMPSILSACISPRKRPFVTTIHDGVPETELQMSRLGWLKFKGLRRLNIRKSDVVTCVSRHNRDIMRTIYSDCADKFVFIPNPVNGRFLRPVADRDEGYVLNFGRQIALKMGVLIDVARLMPETRFVFVGTGDMVGDYGLPNIEFVGFSDAVETYIDGASVCVFPSGSENFPLVGLEAMARGKALIATKRGFSEYIDHGRNGYLLDSSDPENVARSLSEVLADGDLRRRLGDRARVTAEQYRPDTIVSEYERLYEKLLIQRPGRSQILDT
jgi:glycosyltransferase involved in cell wall biosynthesis